MAEFNLLESSISETTANEDIIQLLSTIKPQWNSADVDISTISGGFSCFTYRANLKNNSNDAVTIRVRSLFSNTPLPITDCNYERKIVQVASKLGIFPKIYALFKNGYCYKYVKGKPLVNWAEKLEKPLNWADFPLKKIAQKLAQIHCIQLDDEDFSKSDIYERYRQTLEEYYPDDDDPYLIDKDIIRKEFAEMIGYSKKLNLKVVLCHGDTHPGNMVWNEDDELTLLDWEFTHLGYQAHDIEYLLKFFSAMESLDIPEMPTFAGPPIENVRQKFINFYMEEFFKLNTGSTTVSEEYMKEFSDHMKFMQLMLCLTSIILFGSIRQDLIDSGLPADTMKVIGLRFEMYQKSKGAILRELNLK